MTDGIHGDFIVGRLTFFLEAIEEWPAAAGSASSGRFIIDGPVGFNFLAEFGVDPLPVPAKISLVKFVS